MPQGKNDAKPSKTAMKSSGKKRAAKPSSGANGILSFRVSLAGAKQINRLIEVRDTATLYQLAEAVTQAFGFFFDHAFGYYDNLKHHFESNERFELFADMGDADPGVRGVKKTRATEAFAEPGKKMLFLFDYGDDWFFLIERIERAPTGKGRFPRVVESNGEAPEQYPEETH
jgi:hypothetical protein